MMKALSYISLLLIFLLAATALSGIGAAAYALATGPVEVFPLVLAIAAFLGSLLTAAMCCEVIYRLLAND